MKKVYIALAIVLLIVLGFFREFVFYNINAHINYYLFWQQGMPFYTDSRFEFIYDWKYENLILLKWALTIVFTILFLGNSLLVVWLIYKENKYLKWTIYFFGIIVCLSGLITLINYFSPSENIYRISRLMMDFVESPKPLMLIIPAIYLSRQKK